MVLMRLHRSSEIYTLWYNYSIGIRRSLMRLSITGEVYCYEMQLLNPQKASVT